MTDIDYRELLPKLDIVALERLDEGQFRLRGRPTDWFLHLYPEAGTTDSLAPTARFPFLELFLFDAEPFWDGNEPGVLKSGPWIETDGAGTEFYLEASAINLRGANLLLIEFPKISFKDNLAVIQTGRETTLEHDRLVREIQKKEILLHCIVHDLKGPLSSIVGSASLLASKETLPGQERFLEMVLRQSNRLDLLIQGILHAFSAEIEALQTFDFNPSEAPNAYDCASEVVASMTPTFGLAGVEVALSAESDGAEDWGVVADRTRLERVISNLLGNALRYSPKRSTVTVSLERSESEIVISVADQGPGVPEELQDRLFEKFSQGKGKKSGSAGLGLYFCRITVERWGGRIGYSPGPGGGARFWFALCGADSARATPGVGPLDESD